MPLSPVPSGSPSRADTSARTHTHTTLIYIRSGGRALDSSHARTPVYRETPHCVNTKKARLWSDLTCRTSRSVTAATGQRRDDGRRANGPVERSLVGGGGFHLASALLDAQACIRTTHIAISMTATNGRVCSTIVSAATNRPFGSISRRFIKSDRSSRLSSVVSVCGPMSNSYIALPSVIEKNFISVDERLVLRRFSITALIR